MRIAVSGSHATGKSSLISELARRISGLTTIDELYYALEAEGHAFEAPPSAADFELLLERSISLLAERHSGHVAFDRCPADYLAYLVARSRQAVSEDYVTAVAAALASLDLVVFVPIERPDRVDGAEAPRLRRRVDAILRETLVDGAWDFDVPVLVVRGTPGERADRVLGALAPAADNANDSSAFAPTQPHQR